MILGHGEGELGWLWVGGVAVDNYALEVVILAHCEGERAIKRKLDVNTIIPTLS